MMIFDMIINRLSESGLHGKARRIGSWSDYEIKSEDHSVARYVNVWTNDDGRFTISRRYNRPYDNLLVVDKNRHKRYDITDPAFGDAQIAEIITIIRDWLHADKSGTENLADNDLPAFVLD